MSDGLHEPAFQEDGVTVSDFCECGHPRGWHRKNIGSCLECGCSMYAKEPAVNKQGHPDIVLTESGQFGEWWEDAWRKALESEGIGFRSVPVFEPHEFWG